jgi:hypothetical protein
VITQYEKQKMEADFSASILIILIFISAICKLKSAN